MGKKKGGKKKGKKTGAGAKGNKTGKHQTPTELESNPLPASAVDKGKDQTVPETSSLYGAQRPLPDPPVKEEEHRGAPETKVRNHKHKISTQSEPTPGWDVNKGKDRAVPETSSLGSVHRRTVSDPAVDNGKGRAIPAEHQVNSPRRPLPYTPVKEKANRAAPKRDDDYWDPDRWTKVHAASVTVQNRNKNPAIRQKLEELIHEIIS